jgi:RimJ/RimL family protein N-acetyltransferase
MQFVLFKQKYIRDVISWVKTERDLVQWAGSTFSWPLTQKQFREHLKAAKTPNPAIYPFALLNRGKIAGYCEISDMRPMFDSAMLSRVLVSPRSRSRGLGEFMVKQAVKFGFEQLNLNRIGLGVFDFNIAAARCYTKAGFIYEGTTRESAKAGTEYWNCHIMSLLRKEWKK